MNATFFDDTAILASHSISAASASNSLEDHLNKIQEMENQRKLIEVLACYLHNEKRLRNT